MWLSSLGGCRKIETKVNVLCFRNYSRDKKVIRGAEKLNQISQLKNILTGDVVASSIISS